MAQVILSDLIASLHGSLGKDCPFSFFTKNGKTYTRAKPHRKVSLTQDGNEPLPAIAAPAPNAKQQVSRKRFGQTNKIVNEILHTTHLKAQYEKQWEADVKKHRTTCTTLRGYVFRKIYEETKS